MSFEIKLKSQVLFRRFLAVYETYPYFFCNFLFPTVLNERLRPPDKGQCQC